MPSLPTLSFRRLEAPMPVRLHTYYAAAGPVRGFCGHKHRTPDAARGCVLRDNLGVKRGNGPASYSDRRVVVVVVDGDNVITHPYIEQE